MSAYEFSGNLWVVVALVVVAVFAGIAVVNWAIDRWLD
jgi:hypothetical protein